MRLAGDGCGYAGVHPTAQEDYGFLFLRHAAEYSPIRAFVKTQISELGRFGAASRATGGKRSNVSSSLIKLILYLTLLMYLFILFMSVRCLWKLQTPTALTASAP